MATGRPEAAASSSFHRQGGSSSHSSSSGSGRRLKASSSQSDGLSAAAGQDGRARIEMACLHCRRRKVKCDGNRPCSLCSRLNRPCDYEAVTERENLMARDKKRRAKEAKTARLATLSSLGFHDQSYYARPDLNPSTGYHYPSFPHHSAYQQEQQYGQYADPQSLPQPSAQQAAQSSQYQSYPSSQFQPQHQQQQQQPHQFQPYPYPQPSQQQQQQAWAYQQAQTGTPGPSRQYPSTAAPFDAAAQQRRGRALTMAETRRQAMSTGSAGDRGYSDHDGGGLGGIVAVSPRLTSLSQPTTPEATYQQHWARLQTEMVDTPSVVTVDDPMQSYGAQTQRSADASSSSVDSGPRWNARRAADPYQQQQQQQPFADKVGNWQNAQQPQPQPSGLPRDPSDASPRYGPNAGGATGPIRHRHRRLNSIGSQEQGRRVSNADAAVANFFNRVVEAHVPAAAGGGGVQASQVGNGGFQPSQYAPPAAGLPAGSNGGGTGYSTFPPDDRNASAPHSGSQFDSDRSNAPSAIPTRSSSGTTVSLQGFGGDIGGYGNATGMAEAGSASGASVTSANAWNQQQLHPQLGAPATGMNPYRRPSAAGASHDSRSSASSAGSKMQASPSASVMSQHNANATALPTTTMGAAPASYPSNMRPASQYDQGSVVGMAGVQGPGSSYGVGGQQPQQTWGYGAAGDQAGGYPSWMPDQPQGQQPPPMGPIPNLYAAPHGVAPSQQAVHSTASSYLSHDGGPRTGDSSVSMHSASSGGPPGEPRTGFFDGRTG